jgi:hypothetical protein
MNKITILLCGFLLMLLLIPFSVAEPIEWHNFPKTGKDAGEIFQFRFEIKSDETTNYTITLNPGDEFSAIDGNLSMTKEIPVNATRTFIFDMKIEEDLEDGKHPIPFKAFKDGVQFKTGNIYVRAGQQTPGFEVILLFSAAILVIFLLRKDKSY